MHSLLEKTRGFIKSLDAVTLGICLICSAISMSCLFSFYYNGQRQLKVLIVQGAAILLGLIVALFLSVIDYEAMMKLWKLHAPLAVGLVLLTFVIGVAPNPDAPTDRAWLSLGITTFQPSDLFHAPFPCRRENQSFKRILAFVSARAVSGRIDYCAERLRNGYGLFNDLSGYDVYGRAFAAAYCSWLCRACGACAACMAVSSSGLSKGAVPCRTASRAVFKRYGEGLAAIPWTKCFGFRSSFGQRAFFKQQSRLRAGGAQ